MPGRIQSPSAQLGELLLRGWCMQAEACRDCQLPLMRDPATMLSHCVGCRKVYNSDGDVVQDELQQAPQAAAAAEQPSPPPAATAAAVQPTMNGPISTATSSSSQPAAQAAAITANGAPANATQQPQQPDRDADFEQVQQRYLHMRRQREATSAVAGGSKDPSQLLADKLLEGWTMLGQHCPICNSPLMRSRAMQIRCVVCDLPVQMETSNATPPAAHQQAADAGSTAAEQAGGTGSTAAAQAVARQPGSTASVAAAAAGAHGELGMPANAAAGPGRSASGDELNGSQCPVQPVPTMRVIAPSATAAEQDDHHRQQQAAGGMGHSGGGNMLLQQQRVLSGLQRALLQKLDDSRQLLAATAATQTDDLAKQMQVINQLMQTFAVVKQAMPR